MSPAFEMLERCVQPEPAVSVSPKPESTYTPSANAVAAVEGEVAPDETLAATVVVPVARALVSSTDASLTVDSPAYSDAATPTSADAVGVTVIVGRVPPPDKTGALQTLISVPSEATQCDSSTYVSPPESVTLEAVGLPLPQTPTVTTTRLATVRFAVGVTDKLVPLPCAEICCTNEILGGAPEKRTAFD
jgi:hypothetical protein